MTNTALHHFVEVDEGFYAIYEQSKIDQTIAAQVRELLAEAQVTVVTRYNCSDSMRNIPIMTRIAEHLPGWYWTVYGEDTVETREKFDIQRVPTFIVNDTSGKELGRIIENPASGSLIHDLLAIAQKAALA